ncbi:putative cysteinyl-tRNA synthetase [Monocercomonoides exilis]|uniref:putative cysteinyl-tRNA synthetase n=1 Tax=Monocercomonoides exilis TaxID=2049356 RepID=UPI0035596030|nr:putative cysteinyl-tRNA synthetase [Monocercomonoides exilis]|eukprot:MONOS_7478.1-p1 / transcript=MONOS_7478.1 / gene=MONOS_7478 / organism=Monocercomonoides_exilis_PA203 / gene_product=cysteinyl-tRNA synthetase / transcript_product=cysteinyl-tRNA synthetase / location=Mono_scaffold00256:42005-44789(+) / protein_length=782 / sequence_SO=supercontig / SO=protein_coding / is_pseudo=false
MDQSFKVNCSLHKSVVPFQPIVPGKIKWYNCGPTVYAPAHLGHARNYVGLDVIRRIMMNYFKYDVEFVENVTDIDDKIINKAKELGCSTYAVARFYEADFFNDLKTLNVLPPTKIARATEVVQPIIDYISVLIENGFAYASNGSVYFRTKKYQKHFAGEFSYPELNSGTGLSETEQAELLSEGEGSWQSSVSSADKEDATDFVMWKAKKPGEPAWPSPWGEGRPGWHIECSAMSHVLLGDHFDIHSGGEDLKFPHHDNEIAQSQTYASIQEAKKAGSSSADGQHDHPQRWVNYWFHSGQLNIRGRKMSKSLKNFTTIKQALEIMSPRVLRLLLLMHKFCDTFDFTEDVLTNVRALEKKMVDFIRKVDSMQRDRAGKKKTQEAKAEEKEAAESDEEVRQREAENMMKFFQLHSKEQLKEVGADAKTSSSRFSASASDALAAPSSEIISLSGNSSASSSSSSSSSLSSQASPSDNVPLFVQQLAETKAAVDAALRNSFDTPHVLEALMEMIRTANTQKQRLEDSSLSSPASSSTSPSSASAMTAEEEEVVVKYLVEAKEYLVFIMSVMGIEFSDSSAAAGANDSNANTLTDAFSEMCKFRDQVRCQAQQAMAKKPEGSEVTEPEMLKSLSQSLLKLCDELRDKTLPSLGIRLEDRAKGQPSVWMLVDPEELAKEEAAKKKAEEAKAERKRLLEEANKAKLAKKLAQASIKPEEMFKSEMIEVTETDGTKVSKPKYTQFDEKGIPTHDHEGKELSKNQAKSVMKLYEKQVKIYEKAMKEKQEGK